MDVHASRPTTISVGEIVMKVEVRDGFVEELTGEHSGDSCSIKSASKTCSRRFRRSPVASAEEISACMSITKFNSGSCCCSAVAVVLY